jgi:hypothetical protein
VTELLVPEGTTIFLGSGNAIRAQQHEQGGEDELQRQQNAGLASQLAKLQSQLFPLELLRMRVRVLLERQAAKADQAEARAASTAVLMELLKTEPRRMAGQVYVFGDAKNSPPGGLISIAETSYSAAENSGEVLVTLKRTGGPETASSRVTLCRVLPRAHKASRSLLFTFLPFSPAGPLPQHPLSSFHSNSLPPLSLSLFPPSLPPTYPFASPPP